MAGIHRKIRHTTRNEENELVVNTSFNRFVVLNFIFYVVNVVVVFLFGPFGKLYHRPYNTTDLLSITYRTILTPNPYFIRAIWGITIAWQGFWSFWQLTPSQRNCEGLVTASYHYPFMVLLNIGYTVSTASFRMMWLGCVFSYGICGTMVSASMSLQRYRGKTLKEYMIWQGPLSINTGWMMFESALITNALFVAIDETSTIKACAAVFSLLVLVITAITWLLSYPVDFAIPLVILFAIAGVNVEMGNPVHLADLNEQGFPDGFLRGLRYGLLASLLLVGAAIVIKILVVVFFQRKQEIADKKHKHETNEAINRGRDLGKEAALSVRFKNGKRGQAPSSRSVDDRV